MYTILRQLLASKGKDSSGLERSRPRLPFPSFDPGAAEVRGEWPPRRDSPGEHDSLERDIQRCDPELTTPGAGEEGGVRGCKTANF